MIAPNTPEFTPVLLNGTTPATIIIMWTDGTADIRTDAGETLLDVRLESLTLASCREHPVPYPSCAACGMTVGAVMFRDYEAGTEWADGTCCA